MRGMKLLFWSSSAK